MSALETIPAKTGSIPMELSNGVYVLNSIEDQIKYAKYLIANRLVSETFKSESQLIVAIQLCKDLGLPISCLKDFYVVGGKPAIYGDTFVALALGSGQVEELDVEFYDDKGDSLNIPKKGVRPFSCVVSGKRKGSSKNISISYSMDDRDDSRSANPNWQKFPKDMLYRRAMGRLIKWVFADVIRGIEMLDYAEESTPDRTDNAGQILKAAKEDANRIYQEQRRPEDSQLGPLFLIENGKHRGSRLHEVDQDELFEYANDIRARKDQKPWEKTLLTAIDDFINNIHLYKEQIYELNNVVSA